MFLVTLLALLAPFSRNVVVFIEALDDPLEGWSVRLMCQFVPVWSNAEAMNDGSTAAP